MQIVGDLEHFPKNNDTAQRVFVWHGVPTTIRFSSVGEVEVFHGDKAWWWPNGEGCGSTPDSQHDHAGLVYFDGDSQSLQFVVTMRELNAEQWPNSSHYSLCIQHQNLEVVFLHSHVELWVRHQPPAPPPSPSALTAAKRPL